jgi:DNA-binding NtrC family response regulator
MSSLLIIDDEEAIRDSLARHFTRSGYTVAVCKDFAEGAARLKAEPFDLVITDLRLPGGDGIGIVAEARRASPETPVIVITAFATVQTAVEAIKRGAFDYIQKPFKLEEMELLIERALAHRRLSLENEYLRARLGESEPPYVWGPSPAMKELYRKLEAVAGSEATVLIVGESGTGKEVVARTLHRLSPRRERPFLAVNCAALSAGLLESELFGHEKGAFTGADRMRKGRFELAESGTLLLDEVSEIDPNLQAKLLRVLQERAFERVGSSLSRRADVRVLATTNRDLAAEAAKGRFREDLYYRLNVVPLEVPPLRERREDIDELVRRKLGQKTITPAAMRRLTQYAWPGNVRELQNVVERAVVLSRDGAIDEDLVAPWLSGARPGGADPYAALAGVPLAEVELKLIEATLDSTGGNRERAARLLGITSRTLRDKLKKRE